MDGYSFIEPFTKRKNDKIGDKRRRFYLLQLDDWIDGAYWGYGHPDGGIPQGTVTGPAKKWHT